MKVTNCPRCGMQAFEHLETHSYCWECNHIPEENSDLKIWNDLENKERRHRIMRKRKPPYPSGHVL